MPLTPFIGLSVFIHIAIIIFYKLLHLKKQSPRLIPLKVQSYWLGCVVIFFVFTFVLGGASLLVKASITDEHANFRVVTYFVKKNIAEYYSKRNLPQVAGYSVINIIPKDRPCENIEPVQTNLHVNSLTEFLKVRGLKYSLKSRVSLALGYGIADYTGSAAQNTKLLKILQDEEHITKLKCEQ